MVSGMMENIALVLWGFGGILTEVFRATQNCTLIVNQMINDINIVLVTELICYKKQKHGFCFYCLTCDYVCFTQCLIVLDVHGHAGLAILRLDHEVIKASVKVVVCKSTIHSLYQG